MNSTFIILVTLAIIMFSSLPMFLRSKAPSALSRGFSSTSAANLSKSKNSSNIMSRISTPNEKPPFILIASIGNPEKSYKDTRHSVGHHILHKYCNMKGFSHRLTIGSSIFLSNPQVDNVVFYETQGYMNLSGKDLVKSWKNVLANKSSDFNPVLVVLHDELDLDLGKLKVRKQRASANGHNGLKSIQQNIGKGYTALQIGIGRYYNGDHKVNPNIVSDYVLSKFKNEEMEVLDSTVITKFIDTVELMKQGKYIFDAQ